MENCMVYIILVQRFLVNSLLCANITFVIDNQLYILHGCNILFIIHIIIILHLY